MPADPATAPHAIHATAVAIGDRALLICGAARAGKSRLAIALIARSTPERPIRLVGDDRILLHPVAGRVMARPHPRIAGFIERRGLGIVAVPWVGEAPIGGIVDLGRPGGHMAAMFFHSSPVARLSSMSTDAFERAEHVLSWWAELTAAWAQHPPEKASGASFMCAKD